MDELLKAANDRLKAGNIGITIFKSGSKLRLRGTLPARPPKEGKAQQTIALDIYANPAGIKRSENEARILAGKLALGKFDWGEYLPGSERRGALKVGEAIAEMEREYFTRRERNPKTETTWKVEYLSAFAKLPIDAAIDADLLMSAILSTEPDTRTRKRLCWVYNKIAAFAGIEGFDASPYSGRYRFNRHKLRDLPSDEDIVAMRESIANPEWKYAFSLMAAYGLRNHELFHLDRESLKSGVALILDGKTGRRKAWPFRPEWWDTWKLWEGELPAVTGPNNTEIGSRVTKYFTRAKLCKPYDLRHAWAVRTLEMGLDISLAAQQMGHSLAIHSEIYHDFIGERVHQKAFEEIRKNLLGAD